MTEVQTFDFHGDDISVLERADGTWLFLRQLTSALELDFQAQQRHIARSAWSKSRIAVMAIQVPGDTQMRQHTLIHERIAPMWLANITTSRIPNKSIRERVETYQREFADALHQYVTSGVAIRPGYSSEELIRLDDLPPVALRALANEREAKRQAQGLLAVAGPKAAAYDDLSDKAGALELIEVANILAPVTGGLGRTGLIREMRDMRILQKTKPIPYARHQGHFAVKVDSHGRRIGATTVVPFHGLVWLRAMFIKRRNPQDALFEISGGAA